MFISKFQLFNYKSYINSGLLKFSPGINIVVGQNNSGKTSLLEALTLKFSQAPHLSPKTIPTKLSTNTQKSVAEVDLRIEKEELHFLLKQIQSPVGIPAPQIDEDYLEYINLSTEHDPEEQEEQIEIITEEAIERALGKLNIFLDKRDFLEIKLSIASDFEILKTDNNINQLLNFESYDHAFDKTDINYEFYKIKYDDMRALVPVKEYRFNRWNVEESYIVKYKGLINESIGYKILNIFKSRIYRIYAERKNVGVCKFNNNYELKPDASNLPEVLSIMQGQKPGTFKRFNQYVSIVLPQVKAVSIHQCNNNHDVEILIWTIDPEIERDDLSLPLSSCGSGVSQVLSILCALLSSQHPRTIIIDEPQSFLHPGAAKKLVGIFKEFPQHQYIIATHSPEIITIGNPSTILKLQYEECETKVSMIDSKETKQLRSLLDEVGVRLSDVFGADSILWVEGPTEERCFPLVLEKIAKKLLRGIQILAIKNTGDLEGKRAHIIFDIYDRLSGSASLMPPTIGFVLDSESKSEREMDDLKRRSRNSVDPSVKFFVQFLPRRMYENYLLHSEAIASVINEYDKFREQPLSSVLVQEWIEQKKREDIHKERISDSEWIDKVDGANLLKCLFANFSETRVEFSKTIHSFELTEWLVENKPAELSDLANFLKGILSN